MRKIPFWFTPAVLVPIACPAHAEEWRAPLDYFSRAFGPAALPTMTLDWVFTGIACSVCLIIAFLILTAVFIKRPEQETRAISDGGQGPRWIMIGTAISTVVLFAMAIYALVVLTITATPPAGTGVAVTVTGYDWWWKADYASDDPARHFVIANEIHIPTGVPVLIKLKSADVIHAFWVPQLAGKTQAIPGLTTQQWLQADAPGLYRGQCTQFCGLQHAHMAFEIVAESPADFALWEEQQRAPASPPAPDAAVGREIFANQCGACHAVRGTEANGDHGPDLTHLGSRREIAAGLLTNTPEHLAGWIAHAQELKPGARMPDFAFPQDKAAALSAYLAALK